MIKTDIDNNNLLNDAIINQLKQFNKPIYFSDITTKHWIFDFQSENKKAICKYIDDVLLDKYFNDAYGIKVI